jgi:DNA sulfur modification protein DndC
MSIRIENIIERLIDQYQEDYRYNSPWISGFSGGKDSTVLDTYNYKRI